VPQSSRGVNVVEGSKLVICAFLVFVLPLLGAVAGAVVAGHYRDWLGLSVAAATLGALSAILIARLTIAKILLNRHGETLT